jgi:hypothetical protein
MGRVSSPVPPLAYQMDNEANREVFDVSAALASNA